MKRKADSAAAGEEEAFPRGRPVNEGVSVGGSSGGGDHESGENQHGAQPKGDKTRRKRARKAGGKEEEEDGGDETAGFGTLNSEVITHVPRLRLSDLVEGTLLVGAVREASEDEITVNLPFNIVGHVSRAQATEARFNEADIGEQPEPLPERFVPGQLVVAVVMAIGEKGDSRQHKIDLSLRPSLINAGLTVENIVQHMSVPAVVDSEEEHVLRLDFGVGGLTGLLKKSEVEKLRPAPRVGSILQVTAKQAANKNSKTVACSMSAGGSIGGIDMPLNSIKAGLLVNTRINKLLAAKADEMTAGSSGLVVTFCNVFTGVIHRNHQGQGLSKAPELQRKQLLSARIIAVVPGSQVVVHMSLMPHLLDWSYEASAKALSRVSIGDRLDAQVVDAVPKFGVRLKAPTEAAKGATWISCFCPSSRLADKDTGAHAGEEEAKKMEAGSKVACRVLGYNFLEGALVVTKRPYDLKENTLVSVTELEPGQLVVGEIARVSEFGVFVKLSEYIIGLCHLRHLTDVPLAAVSKKHQVGSKLKCRVLKVDAGKRQVNLTAKKSLVKDAFQLTCFEQACKDMIVTGFVNRVKEYGAIVCFYGDMHGLIPREEMQLDEAPAVGMAVRCRISTLSRKRQRIGLSVDLENGKEPSECASALRDAETTEAAEPGDVVAQVRAVQCIEEGVLVEFRNKRTDTNGAKGFIPVLHLSDSMEQARARHARLTKLLGSGGGSAEDLLLGDGVVLARRFHPRSPKADAPAAEKKEDTQLAWAPLLSVKPTLRLAAEEGAFINDLESLEESCLYSGYVKDVYDFGAVVSLGAWKVAGVAPKHQLADHFIDKPSEELTPGQTVRALVGKIDLEKNRFTVDLRPAAAAPSDAALLRREAEALRLYFQLQALLAPAQEPWLSLLPGTVVDAIVTAVKPYGSLLSLDGHEGITALALKENMPAESAAPQEGESIRCAVLDFDVEKKIVDVSLQPELVAAEGGARSAAKALAGAQKKANKKNKRKKPGGDETEQAETTEVRVLPALQKPAYSVLWAREPAVVFFVPPWEKQRKWTSPLSTVVHDVSAGSGIFDRIVARCPIGGASEQRSQRGERVRVPRILKPAEELSIGAPITMRVQSVKGLQVYCSAPVAVRGHIHATQFLDVLPETGEGARPMDGLSTSKAIEARILQMQQHGEGKRGQIWHLELTCKPSLLEAKDTSEYEAAVVKWSMLKPGKKLQAAVCEIKKNFVWMEVSPTIRGQVNILDATKELSVMKSPADHFKVGQVFDATVLHAVTNQKRLDLSLIGPAAGPAPLGKCLAKLIKVEEVKGRGVAASFRLPGRRKGFVHITELFDVWAQFPLRRLKPGNFYEVCVLRGNTNDEAEGEGEVSAEDARAELSLRPSAVHGQAEGPDERRPLKASDLTVGQKVCGYVVNANDKGVFVALSRSLVGRIKLKALSDEVVLREKVAKLHPVGELLREARVVEVDLERGRVELSLKKGNEAGRLTVDQLSVGDIVSGRVKTIERYGFFVRLDDSRVDVLIHKSEISDGASVSLESFQVGSPIARAKVVKIEDGKVWCSIKPSVFDDEDEMMNDSDDEAADDLDAVVDDSDDDIAAAMAAVAAEEKAGAGATATEEATKEASNEAEDVAATKAAKKKKDKVQKATVDSDDEVPWASAAGAAGATTSSAAAAFQFAGFNVANESGSEDDEDDDEDDDGAEAGKPSKRQKRAAKLAEAKEIRQREEENADGQWANDPKSVEDFERLLLTQGDTSIIWIRYMAFHLKMSDMERARQVAERAVKHVGFAQAKERFNVWVAYMNLECSFGTDQSAEAIFKRAASHNDAKEVHMQLARIHERNKKPDLATKVYEVCCKKFPQSKKVWLAFLTFLYGQGDLEGGRKTLPKCLASVPRRKHPIIVSQAALLEYRHGAPERGRSIFEGLLDSYPKRTDLWSVYIDAHVKAFTPPKVAKPDLAEIRSLLERCCSMKLKAAKMRFFFKRWLDFEKKWGDAESQELVRSKAREFVEAQAT